MGTTDGARSGDRHPTYCGLRDFPDGLWELLHAAIRPGVLIQDHAILPNRIRNTGLFGPTFGLIPSDEWADFIRRTAGAPLASLRDASFYQNGAGAHGAASRRRQSLAALWAAGAAEPQCPEGALRRKNKDSASPAPRSDQPDKSIQSSGGIIHLAPANSICCA